ncbi:MAG: hypothetical protein ACD_15C00193G0007 [uncultured bacterium]|nr:MAG: hypothetical protein ACD_15C00193G0007 [uncultured bacterium]HCU70979.1 hypothetical protein [Candidatus Moranbacteria bacterium]
MHKGIEKKVRIKIVALSILAVFLVLILATGICIYGFGANNYFTGKITKLVPFPAALVDGRSFVTIGELNEDRSSVERFYKNQNFSEIGFRVDFDTEDGRKRLKIKEKKLLNKLIENRVVEKLAAEEGISITKEMAMQNVSREMKNYGSEEYVKKNLLHLYGWNIDDFVEKLVKPDLYRKELESKMRETEVDFVKAEEKIKKVQEELNKKKDFSEMATKYSEAESAKNGGDLGWFTADQMIPEIAFSVFPMKKGDRSDIIESPLGFHIIQVEDRKTEDGIDKVKVRQILVKTKNFAGWLTEKEKNMDIYIPLKEYYWDRDRAVVDFTDNEMKDFESNLEKNSAGDISVLF